MSVFFCEKCVHLSILIERKSGNLSSTSTLSTPLSERNVAKSCPNEID